MIFQSNNFRIKVTRKMKEARPKRAIIPLKLPQIKQKQNLLNNALINKSLKLEKINRQKNIALIDISKINKIEKEFAQISKIHDEEYEQTEPKKDEMRQSKLLLLKNITPQPVKKPNMNLLSSLVEYNSHPHKLKAVNIPQANISVSPTKYKKPVNKVNQKEGVSHYVNAQQLQKVDFVRMFIIEELLYYISKTGQRVKDQMAGFCKFYNENSQEQSYLVIAQVILRNKDYLNAVFFQKLGFYVYLILGTDDGQQQSHYLLNSLSEYMHTNNLIILDLLMQIIDIQKFALASQFHVYNTSRFNQDRRKIRHNQDRMNLVAKNNSSMSQLIKSIVSTCGFDSLRNFVTQILASTDSDLMDKIRQVSLMLVSLDNILASSIHQFANKPKPPFLPQKQKPVPYTLVLDMDQTLIHTKQMQGGKSLFVIRPYCHQFLDQMTKYYQIVIFTAAVKEYADGILNSIDEKKRITYRLYRQHTRIQDYVSIKDLALINRDLSKCIIIDNIASNFKMQPRNGIAISTWTGEPDDVSLLNLMPVLKKLATDQVNDVRDGLEKLSEYMEKQMAKGAEIKFEEVNLKGA